MLKNHRLSVIQFEALAAGGGDCDIVRLLKRAELSKRILQIRALLDHGQPQARHAFDLLVDVQRKAPDIVADILLYPQVGLWAVDCLRQISGSTENKDEIELKFAYLGSITAVAAVRAGAELTVTVPIQGGVVALPSLGCAELGTTALTGMAVVRCRSGGAEVEAAGRKIIVPSDPECDAPGWRGLRRIRSRQNGYFLEICIDDLDPYRDRQGLRPASRLTPSEVKGWQRAQDLAWKILVHHHPERAKAITTGLTVAIPLAHQGGNHGISATATDAFGAVAMSPPDDALLLAETLVHEFQHAKLGALLDLVPLYDTSDEGRYYAPWRDDPRPLGGLLQGVYAYLGVTDFWRRLLPLTSDDVLPDSNKFFVDFQFALWRGQTLRAIHSLMTSGALTGMGARFAEGMLATLESWRDVPVQPDAQALAVDAAMDHNLLWRLRHIQPDHEAVDRLTHAWLDGSACPRVAVSEATAAKGLPRTPDPRADLRLRCIRSGRRGSCPDDAEPRGDIEDMTAADIACVKRDYRAAVRGYCAEVAAEPDGAKGWAGLSLAMPHVAPGPAAGLLSTRPELVAAVHRRVRELADYAPDPVELATWLAAWSTS